MKPLSHNVSGRKGEGGTMGLAGLLQVAVKTRRDSVVGGFP